MTSDTEKHEIAYQFEDSLKLGNRDMLQAIVADDVIMTMPGNSRVSGEWRGIDGLTELMNLLRQSGMRAEIEAITYGLNSVALRLHNTGIRGDRHLDQLVVVALFLRGRRIIRVDSHMSDLENFNAFFGSVDTFTSGQ
ncbi:hypothetical protein OG992_33740 [Micromonospora sp. NBC_00362]|uniref:nuclear transport factor 2 family protein n=1 Tax=Micromonospora sp. NBC_00362 TaxID=2975975 RepID=UPI002257D35E|nr:nuclear transport factor 2 family protein [Micromonospora sp. NBC_00362]MCX5122120.1 hypothetical protein [Micromonospora sp. NBC_00362]